MSYTITITNRFTGYAMTETFTNIGPGPRLHGGVRRRCPHDHSLRVPRLGRNGLRPVGGYVPAPMSPNVTETPMSRTIDIPTQVRYTLRPGKDDETVVVVNTGKMPAPAVRWMFNNGVTQKLSDTMSGWHADVRKRTGTAPTVTAYAAHAAKVVASIEDGTILENKGRGPALDRRSKIIDKLVAKAVGKDGWDAIGKARVADIKAHGHTQQEAFAAIMRRVLGDGMDAMIAQADAVIAAEDAATAPIVDLSALDVRPRRRSQERLFQAHGRLSSRTTPPRPARLTLGRPFACAEPRIAVCIPFPRMPRPNIPQRSTAHHNPLISHTNPQIHSPEPPAMPGIPGYEPHPSHEAHRPMTCIPRLSTFTASPVGPLAQLV